MFSNTKCSKCGREMKSYTYFCGIVYYICKNKDCKHYYANTDSVKPSDDDFEGMFFYDPENKDNVVIAYPEMISRRRKSR